MTPEAIRFYLPAYLLASIIRYRESDQIPGSIMFLLRLPEAGDLNANVRFRARFGSLTERQVCAIRAYLQYFHDEHAEDFPSDGGGDEALELLEDRWPGLKGKQG
jgi:hypothetical protein